MSATGGAAAVMIPPVTVDEATTPPRRRRQSASGRTGAAETLLAIHTNSSPSPSPRSVAAGATPAVTPSPATAPHFPVETQDTAGNALSTIRRGLSASAGAGAKPGSSGSKHKYPRPSLAERRLKSKGANLLKAPAHIQINVAKEASLGLGQGSPGVDNLLGSPTFRTALNTPGITQTMLDEALKSPLLQRKMGMLVKHHLSTGTVGGGGREGGAAAAAGVSDSALQYSALPALTPLMQSGDFAAKIAEAFKSPLPFAQMGGTATYSRAIVPSMTIEDEEEAGAGSKGQANLTLNTGASAGGAAAATGNGRGRSSAGSSSINASRASSPEADDRPGSPLSHLSHTLPLPVSTLPLGAQHSRATHNDLFSEFKTDIDISAAAAKAKTLIAEHHQYVQKRHMDSLTAVMPQSAGLSRAFGAGANGVGSTSAFGYGGAGAGAGAGAVPMQMYLAHLQNPPPPQMLHSYNGYQPPQQYITMQQQQYMQQQQQQQQQMTGMQQQQQYSQPSEQVIKTESGVPKQVPMYEPGSLKAQPKATRVKCVKVAEDEGMKICKLGDGTFKCPTCNKISKRKSDHIKHQRTHSKSKPYECTYPQCSARFSDPSTRSRHIKAHDPAARINCTYPGCGKEYSRQANMIRHLMTHDEYEEYMPQEN